MHSESGRPSNFLATLALAGLLAVAAFTVSACSTATSADTWVKPNQNASNTRYVGGRIFTGTVQTIGVSWTADIETRAGNGAGAPSPYITKDGVFVQDRSGRIVALDFTTGERKPGVSFVVNKVARAIGGLSSASVIKFSPATSPVLTTGKDDNKILVGGKGGTVEAVATAKEEEDDSDIPWKRTLEAPSGTEARVISNIAAAHEKIYVPVANVPDDLTDLSASDLYEKVTAEDKNNGQLVALNSSDGKVAWTKKLASVPLGAATVVNDIVFTSTLDGHLYGFNAGNGDQVFESELPAGAVAPIAASNGTLIVPASAVLKKGQKAQVVAFSIGGLGSIGGAEAPKLVQKDTTGGETAAKSEASGGGEAAAGAGAAEGKTIFTENCGGCHTLADAGTSGNAGPNLDALKDDAATIEKQVENGGGGMPPFKGTLSPEEIQAVAAYVASVDGS